MGSSVSVESINLSQMIEAEGGFTSVQSLTTSEIVILLNTSLLPEYREIFTKNNINGRKIRRCREIADFERIGIRVNEKAEMFFQSLLHAKSTGVPRVLCKSIRSKAREVYHELCRNARISLLRSLKEEKYTKAKFISGGFSLLELRESGLFLARDLIVEGWRYDELHAVGYTETVAELKTAGCTATQLRISGVTLDELVAVRFSCKDLLHAGFFIQQLVPHGYDLLGFKAAGCSASELFMAGVSASSIATSGYGLRECLHGQLPLSELVAHFPAQMLRDFGVSVQDMRNAGVRPYDLRLGGYTLEEMRQSGFGLKDLLEGGFKIHDIKGAGYTTSDFQRENCSVRELRDGGFTLEDIITAGYSPRDIRDAGYEAQDVHAMGNFSAKDMRTGGYTFMELGKCGFSLSEFKAADFTIAEARAAGFRFRDFKGSHYTVKELKSCGVSALQLRALGYSQEEIIAGGFLVKDTNDADNRLLAEVTKLLACPDKLTFLRVDGLGGGCSYVCADGKHAITDTQLYHDLGL